MNKKAFLKWASLVDDEHNEQNRLLNLEIGAGGRHFYFDSLDFVAARTIQDGCLLVGYTTINIKDITYCRILTND